MSTSTKKIAAAEAPTGVVAPTGGGRSGFLSDVIVELEFASRETVEQAVRAARSPGTTVARVLVEMGAITEAQLARATAERYGIDYVDLAGFHVDPAAANLIKPTTARRYQAVPVGYLGDGLLVAMADPADALGVNDIAVMTKLDVRPAVASRPALEALLEALPLAEDGWEGGGEATDEDVPQAEAPGSAADLPPDGAVEEARTGELDSLRAKLEYAETELARVRAEADARGSELEAMRIRTESAEREAEEALQQASAAEERHDEARQALAQVREEGEREREQAAMTERELREKLGEEEHRRGELEGRLSEVEGAAFAAERSFEELRLAQARMREALRALADPDEGGQTP